ncbi:MAG: PhzF family phenazine biosynthesis protein [Pseudomonadota bacterium]
MSHDFDWVDAFADRAFGGNGCAVVHDYGDVAEDVACAFVRETSLVECTFTGPSDIADIRVRYFLARNEIPFAGHPTVATVAAMRHRGLIGDGDLTLETGAGLVPVRVDGLRVTMRQIAPTFGATLDPALVARVGGLTPSDLIAPPQIVSTGLPFVIAPLRDAEAVRRVALDAAALQDMMDHIGAGVMEPFWATTTGAPAGDTFARLVLPPPNPPEDPFTGSATGALGAYVWAHGLIDSPQFTAAQGHDMGRPGLAQVRVLGPREAITGVEVTGSGYVLMSGTVALPDG